MQDCFIWVHLVKNTWQVTLHTDQVNTGVSIIRVFFLKKIVYAAFVFNDRNNRLYICFSLKMSDSGWTSDYGYTSVSICYGQRLLCDVHLDRCFIVLFCRTVSIPLQQRRTEEQAIFVVLLFLLLLLHLHLHPTAQICPAICHAVHPRPLHNHNRRMETPHSLHNRRMETR